MLIESGYKGSYTVRAINDFVPHSEVESAYKKFGFDIESIANTMNGEKQ